VQRGLFASPWPISIFEPFNIFQAKDFMATITSRGTMKGVRIHDLGGPEVLRYEDIPIPEPGADEVLVRVHAAGVNPVDWKIREGHLGHIALPAIMGTDFSGVIDSVGPGVTGFRVGEAVFGEVADDSGSYAEYAIAPATQIAAKPEDLDHIQTAALPIAAGTAWQALFDVAHLQPGQKILVHAAAGGVGTFAVQFAKWKGARVYGTASSQSAEFLRGIVDELIDYHSTRFEDVAREVDVVFDTLGGEIQGRSWQVLKPGGVLVSVVQPPPQEKATHYGVRGAFLVHEPKGEQFAQIAELVARDQVTVHVETVLPLHQARKAQELSQTGHAHGKIVLFVDSLQDS
jgi:NADPH:quinone reductase-like Zn-dependent oxidoreductase